MSNDFELAATLQNRIDEARADLEDARDRTGTVARATLKEEDELWAAGYLNAGGKNLTRFIDVILPCESGGSLDPHRAVGPTDDWGRGQVNRHWWKDTFEHLFGVEFETGILDPELNGQMVAHIEYVQGLNAWTCHRIH